MAEARRRASAVLLAAVLVAGCAAGSDESAASTSSPSATATTDAEPVGVLPASDEFEGTTVSDWTIAAGDDVGDGVDHSVAVSDGALVLQPRRSWWVHGNRALFLSHLVTGDFVATVRLSATGADAAMPSANWSLSGILARAPDGTTAGENWVSLRAGVVDGRWVDERKTTVDSTSSLVLEDAPGGWRELRLARFGDRFFLLVRDADGWRMWWVYSRSDLPDTIEIGVDAFSGYESASADLVSTIDWVRFTPIDAPSALLAADPDDLLPYLTAE